MLGFKPRLGGEEPRAHRQETGATPGPSKVFRGHSKIFKTTGQAAGLVAGTTIATATGWRDVDRIAEGDLVLTFDCGMQPVRSVKRGQHWDGDHSCPMALRPFRVPAEALGNTTEMWLLPEECVMIDNDAADMLFDDPFPLVSASHLAGFRGIQRVEPPACLTVVHLEFDADQVIFANSGALVFCPKLGAVNIGDLMNGSSDAPGYNPLSAEEAGMLLEQLEMADMMASISSLDGESKPAFTARA